MQDCSSCRLRVIDDERYISVDKNYLRVVIFSARLFKLSNFRVGTASDHFYFCVIKINKNGNTGANQL